MFIWTTYEIRCSYELKMFIWTTYELRLHMNYIWTKMFIWTTYELSCSYELHMNYIWTKDVHMNYIWVLFRSRDKNLHGKCDFGDFRSSIVDPIFALRNVSFGIWKICVCKEQNFLVPHFSVWYLWIQDPLNMESRQNWLYACIRIVHFWELDIITKPPHPTRQGTDFLCF